jgi:hypothetical protein
LLLSYWFVQKNSGAKCFLNDFCLYLANVI